MFFRKRVLTERMLSKNTAVYYSQLGEKEAAFAALEKAFGGDKLTSDSKNEDTNVSALLRTLKLMFGRILPAAMPR